MKSALIAKLIEIIIGMFSPDLLKWFVDKLLDLIEEAVIKSEGKLDDKIVLPLCSMIRETFDIPDND